MSIPTQMSLVGFIASAPELHFTKQGAECCRLRVGVEQWRKEVDGSFTKLDPTFHDMVAFESTARETYARFRKGDSFVASGYIHEYEVESRDGQRHQGGVRRPQDRPQRQQDRLRRAARPPRGTGALADAGARAAARRDLSGRRSWACTTSPTTTTAA